MIENKSRKHETVVGSIEELLPLEVKCTGKVSIIRF